MAAGRDLSPCRAARRDARRGKRAWSWRADSAHLFPTVGYMTERSQIAGRPCLHDVRAAVVGASATRPQPDTCQAITANARTVPSRIRLYLGQEDEPPRKR